MKKKGELITYSDGTKEWCLNGKLHREDGPAVEFSNGTKYWYLNGQCHRVDGPAVEYPDGTKAWYLNGEPYDKTSYYNLMVKLGHMTEEEGFLELI